MPENFYVSDTHFSHKNILKFDERPFASIEEMETTLVKNWNKKVTNADTVYILGDFCWGKENEWLRILSSLKGNKVLIKGNHDLRNPSARLKNCFSDIKDYKEIKDKGRTVIMCHYPILAYVHSYNPDVFMLHGHVHNRTGEAKWIKKFVQELREKRIESYDNRGQIINVGCMMPWMNFTPMTLDELTEFLDKGLIYGV